MSPGMGRSFVWVALCIAAIVPLTAGDQLPFLDWPQHLALANIVRHLDDPAWHFEMYEIDLRPLPYRLFTWLTALLPLPIGIAGRVVLGASLVATPLALAFLLRTMGRDERLAWLAFPLLYGKVLFLGFAPFLAGVPLWLLGTALAERHFTGRSSGWPIGVVAVATYFAHGWAALALLLSLAVLAAVHRPGWKPFLPLLPFLALVAYWVFLAATDPAIRTSPDHPSTVGLLFQTPGEAIGNLPDFLFEVHRGHADEMLFLGLFLVWAALVVARRDPVTDWRGARLEILAGVFVVSYFLVPLQDAVAFDLPARTLYLTALLLPAFAGARPFEGRELLLVPIVIVGLAVPAFYTRELSRFAREARSVQELAARASDGGRTLGLVYDTGNGAPFASAPYLHSPQWLQVYRGGDASSSFAGFPLVPVRYRPGARLPSPDEWNPGTLDFGQLSSWTRVLVRGRPHIPPPIFAGAQKWESGAFQLIELPQ
jgi:hypothetical protein